jgi:hypothetical protein
MSFMTDSNENARVGRLGEDTSRRRFLQGMTGTAFGAALVSPGIYKMIDTIAKPPARPTVAGIQPIQEQYLLQNEQVINVDPQGVESSNGSVAIRVPTLYDDVITARLNVPANANALREAQHHLESVLLDLERQFPPTPSGMGIMVAWGLPYFQRYIPRLRKASEFFNAGTPYPRYLPIDVSTSKMEGHTVYAVQEART